MDWRRAWVCGGPGGRCRQRARWCFASVRRVGCCGTPGSPGEAGEGVGDEAMPVRGSPGMSGGGEAARWRRTVAAAGARREGKWSVRELRRGGNGAV
jgi:hypothetical protein